MLPRRWRRRVKVWLFGLTLVAATGLLAVVTIAPFLDRGGEMPENVGLRVLTLFARDTALRRTTLASALGLVVTAFAFFRPPGTRPPRAPSDVVGA
ncbi:MAG: hypothetical protein U0746_00445 [Gemmataceae bacterium]